MKTVKIEIEPKKGERMVTTWGVWQDWPCPDIHGHSGRLQWRNTDGILAEFGRNKSGLASSYGAALLREGYTPETAKGNREDYAGCVPYNRTDVIPGAIVYRGRSLGETTAQINRGPWGCVRFQVRGNIEPPTAGESKFLSESVAPALLAFIADNAQALKAEAIAKIRKQVDERIAETRASLDELEAEMNTALAAL